LTLGGLVAVALPAGFKVQKGLWPWQDPPGFQAYTLEWWRLTKETGGAAAAAVKKKADESGLTATTEDLIERAKRVLAGDAGAASTGSAAGAAMTAPPEVPPSGGDPAPALETPAPETKLPPGYAEAFKAGKEAYREGLVHFRAAVPRSAAEQKELRAAKAATLYADDSRLESLRRDLNQYLLDCNKRIKPTY